MAKFFNEQESYGDNNSFIMDENQGMNEEAPSFVSASDVVEELQNNQEAEQVQEVYYQPTDSSEFSNNGNQTQENFSQNNGVPTVQFYVDPPINNQETLNTSASVDNLQNEFVQQNESVQQNEFVQQNEYQQEFQNQAYENPSSMEMNMQYQQQYQPTDNINQYEVGQEYADPAYQNNEMTQVVQEEQVMEPTNNDLSNIEDSSAFTNVETSYVVDNSYKGVDNTGKVGEEIQNPVYNDSFEKNDVNVSGNIIAVLLVLFEVLLSPGKSVIRNTEKYVKGKKAFKVFINVIIYEFIFSFIGHIIAGCFVDKMSFGEYRKVLDFSNITHLNYLNILISTAIVSLGLVILIALINYATSFFSNKSLSLNSYLLIATLSFFPLVLAINTFIPMLNVMSLYFSIGLFIISFSYSFLIYVNALWGIMEFKGDNAKVFYLLFNFIVISVIIVILILVFFEDYVNAIRVIFK